MAITLHDEFILSNESVNSTCDSSCSHLNTSLFRKPAPRMPPGSTRPSRRSSEHSERSSSGSMTYFTEARPNVAETVKSPTCELRLFLTKTRARAGASGSRIPRNSTGHWRKHARGRDLEMRHLAYLPSPGPTRARTHQYPRYSGNCPRPRPHARADAPRNLPVSADLPNLAPRARTHPGF